MLEDPPILVTAFVEGETVEPEQLREPGPAGEPSRARCAGSTTAASSCRRSSPRSGSWRPTRETAAEPRRRPLPDGYHAARKRAKAIEKALRGPEHEPVPCHNDLLAGNLLRRRRAALRSSTGSTRGWATATSTWATWRSTTAWTTTAEDAAARGVLRRARPTPRRLACLRLMRFMSDFREAMWGVVQSAVSELDFDFDGYAARALRATRAQRRASRLLPLAQGGAWRSTREPPSSARCVIVGGGVGGTSIAYHLAQLGMKDVVLVDRNQLTSGSTFHSAGLVGQLRGSVSLTKMMMYSVELYRRLGGRVGVRPGLDRVRRHPARLERGAAGGAAPPGRAGRRRSACRWR